MEDRIVIYEDGSWEWESDTSAYPRAHVPNHIIVEAPFFPNTDDDSELEAFECHIRYEHYKAFVMGQGI